MQDAKPLPTPMSISTLLLAHQGSPSEDHSLYKSATRGLQYDIISRPDISFAVNRVCQYISNPLDSH